MLVRRGVVAITAGLGVALAALPAKAENQTHWAGPYIEAIGGDAWGTGAYHFNTDGWFNDNPGDAFSAPVHGYPLGVGLGQNWQTGRYVYGFEATFLTAVRGISHADVDSPYLPGDQNFDLKGHWFGALTARAGVALGPVLFSVNAGPAVAHLVTYANDTVTPVIVQARGPVVGLAAGVSADIRMSPRFAVGLSYEYMAFAPLTVHATGVGETDHTIRFAAHMVTARITMLTGPATESTRARAAFDWAGPFVGPTVSSFHELGMQAGYNYVVGQSVLVGATAQAATVICVGVGTCGPLQFETDLSARIGYLAGDNILVYGKAGIGYMTGTHFGFIGGALYMLGTGVEVALSPRTSGFMELEGVGELGGGLFDANFRGGINIHLAGLHR